MRPISQTKEYDVLDVAVGVRGDLIVTEQESLIQPHGHPGRSFVYSQHYVSFWRRPFCSLVNRWRAFVTGSRWFGAVCK